MITNIVFSSEYLNPQILLIVSFYVFSGQVRRMLRLSVEENKRVKEFQDICEEAKERGFGRVFRSPTLFEDMVKCMLLCNCQWSRTLTMAEALCELQLELNCPSSAACFSVADNRNQLKGVTAAESEHFTPKTPAGKESRKRAGAYGCSRNLLERLTEVEEIFVDEEKPDVSVRPAFPDGKEVVLQKSDLCQATAEVCEVSTSEPFNSDPSEDGELSFNKLGNFPSPKELAGLDESFLAKRCGLGYRAGRIIKLAKGIVEGRIQLKELEEACSNPSLSNYDKMAEQLREIDGFGPFTCANVLMCLGYYHVIPTDSETVRHLKQVHAKTSTTIKTVQTDVEKIYGKYEPFQFLAYWSEVWHFYDEWFGKLSELPHSQYKLITAANMRPKRNVKCKKLKITSAEKLGM
ncbi:uncharacterized protein LOC132598559 isoform X2 [Lycium barbarum]|uniref:uncharacterized protein LOC132598559 isoform X2 n=1 Tax=Lycium barbarum TaxID=112863 RepID=UPI00293E710B|nr:uncharacterized protein LOC132598559 isoform X2 [Lycium barbarum]